MLSPPPSSSYILLPPPAQSTIITHDLAIRTAPELADFEDQEVMPFCRSRIYRRGWFFPVAATVVATAAGTKCPVDHLIAVYGRPPYIIRTRHGHQH